MSTESGQIETNPSESAPVEDPATYKAAIETYLREATWLTAADAPLKVHARTLADSLDLQFTTAKQIQSALASSFDKVMQRLDARRPPPAPAQPSLGDSGPMGEQSLFLPLD